MITKRKRHAATPIGKQAAELHNEFLRAIRAGRATRRQFDAWHAQHRGGGRGLTITLREVKTVSASGTASRHGKRPVRSG